MLVPALKDLSITLEVTVGLKPVFRFLVGIARDIKYITSCYEVYVMCKEIGTSAKWGKENTPNNNHSHELSQFVGRIPVVNLNNMAGDHEQHS